MGEKSSGKDLVPAHGRVSTLSGKARLNVVQLDTLYLSTRKDMIMCPGRDTMNFSVSEEGESLWLGLGKASIKEVRLYFDLKDIVFLVRV